ncbi:MAG: hypothetical protein ACFFBP_09345 [Promethearchaeota archaeon]
MQEYKDKIEFGFRDWGQVLNVGEFIEEIKKTLDPSEYNSENSRLVFSVCSDDCNRLAERETIEKALTKTYGREFHLGGLAGYPVGGVSGIIAASHHVPDIICTESQQIRKGNLIFFISPHIGMIKKQDFYYGRLVRSCQESPTGCCGAMMGFLSALKQTRNIDNFNIAYEDKNLDPTRVILHDALINEYPDQLNNILAMDDVNSQIIKLTMINHDLISEKISIMIDEFLKREKASFQGKIGFITGITVNCSNRDYFVLKEVRSK